MFATRWRFVLIAFMALIAMEARLSAQSILTVAGGGTDDGRPATTAGLAQPRGMALDASGNLYIADRDANRIRKVAAGSGIISAVAGNGAQGFSGDGGPATAASLGRPSGLSLDAAGNLYIADTFNGRIRKVAAGSGIISTVAGNGARGFSGDGGPATAAGLSRPDGVALDTAGNLFIADTENSRIRKVAAGSGIISTVAGNGDLLFSGDGGPATAAALNRPSDVALDVAGNLYIAEQGGNRIRKVAAGSGIISTVAGNGAGGFSGDGGPATAASLDFPSDVALDAAGNLYIADAFNYRIRKVAAGSGIISTVAGSGPVGEFAGSFSGDGGLATAATLLFPEGVALDAAGNLYIAENRRIRKVAAGSGIISTVAGGGFLGFLGDGGPATAATLRSPRGVASDALGNLYIADTDNSRIHKVAAGSGIISTVAGSGRFLGDGGPATAAGLNRPYGVALDSAGNLYIADTFNSRIRKVAAGSGIISTVAGNGDFSFSGDGGPATAASLRHPFGVALDAAGNLYIADTDNYRIRKVAAESGIIATVAGNGTPPFEGPFSGDGGPATSAVISPHGVALDTAGNLYIADNLHCRIRRVAAGSGIISTVAGNGAIQFSGDGGPATAASLGRPSGVALDAAGNLYIADTENHRIRKVAAGSGIIATVAGNGVQGFSGDGGPATAAGLSSPSGVAVDGAGNLYIADTGSNRIRAVLACITVAAPTLTLPATGATGIATGPTLIWNKVDGAFRYDVYLSTTNPPSLIASDLSSTTFAPSNLTAGVTYFWRVVAKGDQFCSPQSTATSEIRSFTTLAGCTAPGGFDVSLPGAGASSVPQSVQLSWQSAPGAGTYDLFFGAANPPVLFAGGLSTTSFAVSNLTSNTTYYWSLVAHASCDASKVRSTAVRSFSTVGGCSAAGPFNQTAPAGGASNVPLTTTLEWTPSANASSYDVYLGTSSPPPVYLSDVTRTRVGVSGLAASRTYFWRIVAKVACDASKNVSSPTSMFVTASECPVPRTTAITFVPLGNVGVGQTYTVVWREVPDLDEDGFYVVERSLAQSFSQIVDSQQTFSPSASFVSNSAGTYYHRVHAVRGCNPSRPGTDSDVKSVNVVTGSANVIFTVQPQAVVTTLGEKLEDRKTSLTIENLGTSSLQVSLPRLEIDNSVPFFTVHDPLGGNTSFVTLEPKKPKTFEVRFSGPPNDRTGAYQGLVYVVGPGLAITPYAFVNLKVGGGATSRPVFVASGTPTEYAFFPGFAGDDASRPPISISIRNQGSSPMELGAEIGPEVWLVPESGWNASPIPPGASRPVPLRAMRSLAPNESALPRYTYFVVRSKNGETARLLVQDNDAVQTGTGRSLLLEPGSRSYVVPAVTSSSAGGTTVMSRLRLTNVGSEPVQTELFFTPAGSDGFDGASVKRATVVVPPNDVVTLTDPLAQVFGLTPPAQGQIEVRAAPERIGFLIVSASVITPVITGGAHTYQLATLRLGEGARVGSGHVILGLDTSGSARTSLTLAETTGTEATRVRITVFDAQGSQRGQTSESIARYGQKTIDLAALISGASIEGGRVDLIAESGGGSVAGVVTMLGASQNSGATLVSQPAAGTVSGSALRQSGRMRPSAGTQLATAVVPVVVNGALPAGTSSPPGPPATFRTSMGFTTSGSPTTIVLVYRPSDPAAAAVEKTVQLIPGFVRPFGNVLEQLFGVPAGASAQGSIFVQAAAGSLLYAGLVSSAGVGAGGGMGGSLPIFGTLSEVISSLAQRRPLYLDGLEQSTDPARGSRWNLLVNETAGSGGSVTVRLYEAGNRNLPIAEKTMAIRGYEQIRLDTVFASLGLDTEERRKDRTNVLCMVTAAGGNAVISAVGVATDNATGDTKHYQFSPSGGVPATGVLSVSAVTQVTPPPPPPPATRRRGVRRGP